MSSDLLDHTRLLPLEKKKYARVFEPHWGDVFTTNPMAKGRFSLKDRMPEEARTAAGWYVSDTQSGALWESVLRDVAPDHARGVSLDISKLEANWLQWVSLEIEKQVLRLERPKRRHVIAEANHKGNKSINDLLETDLYPLTHAAAGMLQLQFRNATPSVELPGISWTSRQSASDIVYVLYEPPLDRTEWKAVGSPIQLSSAKGMKILRDTLAKEGMVWLEDPARAGGTPLPGAI